MLSRRSSIVLTSILFVTFLLAVGSVSRAAENPYGVAAYTILDNETGYILESSNGIEKRQVASLTKIATAMVVLDWCQATNHDVSELAAVPAEVARMEGANPVGLAPGDFVSLRDLLYCSLLQSDNAAAYTLAAHVGRSLKATSSKPDDLGPVDTFVAQMNALARSLGMNNTLFLNPHGLEPRKGMLPHSSSDNMARLARYAMKDKGFRFYVSQKERKISIVRALKPEDYLLRNTNELLGQDGIDGVKTGRTAAAGECLILSSTRAPETREEAGKTYITPRRVTVVLLGAQNRFAAGAQLLRRAWSLEEQWAAGGRRTNP
ncbi:MAG TPA: serine hydrolase [Chthoniobacterales bacterium]|jgi:D-alanyl-D-alanine carboxypeptidase (penicillin-binding protein 5/6)